MDNAWQDATSAWCRANDFMSKGNYTAATLQFEIALKLYNQLRDTNNTGALKYVEHMLVLCDHNSTRCKKWKRLASPPPSPPSPPSQTQTRPRPTGGRILKGKDYDALMSNWSNAQEIFTDITSIDWIQCEDDYFILPKQNSKEDELEQRIEDLQFRLKKKTIELNILQNKCYFAFRNLNESVRDMAQHARFLFPYGLLSRYTIQQNEILRLTKKKRT
jgi:hypothetical protein